MGSTELSIGESFRWSVIPAKAGIQQTDHEQISAVAGMIRFGLCVDCFQVHQHFGLPEFLISRRNECLLPKTRWLVVVAGLILAAPLAADWPQWRGSDRDGVTRDFTAPTAWPATLKETWKVTVGEGHSSPVTSEGRIYVLARQGEDEVVFCLEAPTGKQLWRASYPARLHHESGSYRPRQGPQVHAGCQRREALHVSASMGCCLALTPGMGNCIGGRNSPNSIPARRLFMEQPCRPSW